MQTACGEHAVTNEEGRDTYVLTRESHNVKVRIGSFSSTVRWMMAWMATEGSAILADDHGSKRKVETHEVSDEDDIEWGEEQREKSYRRRNADTVSPSSL